MRIALGTFAAIALLLLATLAALAHGPIAAAPGDLLAAALGRRSPLAETALSLRLPRVATALLVGGVLSGAGAAFQIVFRNPLVAPDLLGVSSGAGLSVAGAPAR